MYVEKVKRKKNMLDGCLFANAFRLQALMKTSYWIKIYLSKLFAFKKRLKSKRVGE